MTISSWWGNWATPSRAAASRSWRGCRRARSCRGTTIRGDGKGSSKTSEYPSAPGAIMFRFKIRQQAGHGERWRVIGEPPATDLVQPIHLPDVAAAESDLLSLWIYPPAGCNPAVRVYVGSVLV